jgi:putative oxidoreductase
MNIGQWLFSERGKDFGLLLLRIGFGAGMVYHGWGKVAGGAEGVIGFAASVGFPAPAFFGWAAALSEFLGGIGLLLGLLTRPSAFFIGCTMVTAAFVRHAEDPFGVQEKPLAYLVAAVCLLIAGAGYYSLDRILFNPVGARSDDE